MMMRLRRADGRLRPGTTVLGSGVSWQVSNLLENAPHCDSACAGLAVDFLRGRDPY